MRNQIQNIRSFGDGKTKPQRKNPLNKWEGESPTGYSGAQWTKKAESLLATMTTAADRRNVWDRWTPLFLSSNNNNNVLYYNAVKSI